jgi:hypothetical protein
MKYLLGMAEKYHIIGSYGGHKWHGFWLKVWMHEKHSLSVQGFG